MLVFKCQQAGHSLCIRVRLLILYLLLLIILSLHYIFYFSNLKRMPSSATSCDNYIEKNGSLRNGNHDVINSAIRDEWNSMLAAKAATVDVDGAYSNQHNELMKNWTSNSIKDVKLWSVRRKESRSK